MHIFLPPSMCGNHDVGVQEILLQQLCAHYTHLTVEEMAADREAATKNAAEADKAKKAEKSPPPMAVG